MWLPYGKEFIILTSTVSTDPPVCQTDGQTLSIKFAICCRALKTNVAYVISKLKLTVSKTFSVLWVSNVATKSVVSSVAGLRR